MAIFNMSCDEISEVNDTRRLWERLHGFPSMFTRMNELSLKRIDIARSDPNDNRCSDINPDKYYLVGYSGHWTISKPMVVSNSLFRNKTPGWAFDVGWHTSGLGFLDFLFEIENDISYEKNPLGYLDYPDSNEGEHCSNPYCEKCRGDRGY